MFAWKGTGARYCYFKGRWMGEVFFSSMMKKWLAMAPFELGGRLSSRSFHDTKEEAKAAVESISLNLIIEEVKDALSEERKPSYMSTWGRSR